MDMKHKVHEIHDVCVLRVNVSTINNCLVQLDAKAIPLATSNK